MQEAFFIAFREAFQAAVLLALVLFSATVRDDASFKRSLLLGFFLAAAAGFSAGALSGLGTPGSHETWTFWRHLCEAALFYGSIVLLARGLSPSRTVVTAALFLLGFLLVVFESRSLGFIIHDMGASTGRIMAAFGSAGAGLLLGALPVTLLSARARKLPFDRIFTPASLLMSIGALQLWFGGVDGPGGESIIMPLQHGLQLFINEFMKSAQAALLVSDHPFLDAALSGPARFAGSDRSALTVTILFLMAPPVIILIALFSRPDPVAAGDNVTRRRSIASFRQDLTLQAAPVLIAFIGLVFLVHAVNLSMNPLYDPEPVPIRISEGGNVLKIPISGKAGDFGDKKLRKYVYYEGNRQVLLLAALKPDGTVGLALDQCEICRPADWNKDARGYAQQGKNLFCKYCVTPIAMSTLNTPGGCNPIPVPFRVVNNTIIINTAELVAVFDKAEALERKGTHL